MGLFDKLFGSTTEAKQEKVLPWIFLTSVDQLDDIENKSYEKPQIIFKHSTRCSISSISMNKFVKNYSIDNEAVDLYYLDLLSYRDVSNEVGYKFQILHQSPQVLVIKDGKVIYDASHYAIQTDKILEFV